MTRETKSALAIGCSLVAIVAAVLTVVVAISDALDNARPFNATVVSGETRYVGCRVVRIDRIADAVSIEFPDGRRARVFRPDAITYEGDANG